MLDKTLQYLHSVDPFDWADLSSLSLYRYEISGNEYYAFTKSLTNEYPFNLERFRTGIFLITFHCCGQLWARFWGNVSSMVTYLQIISP